MTTLEKKLQNRVCEMKKKLPPVFKKKLLKALRSGKYDQCTGTLYEDGAYCVMGVVHKLVYPNRTPEGGNISGNQHKGKVPAVFLDKMGHTSEIQNELIDMNDGGSTFKELATYISKKL